MYLKILLLVLATGCTHNIKLTHEYGINHEVDEFTWPYYLDPLIGFDSYYVARLNYKF